MVVMGRAVVAGCRVVAVEVVVSRKVNGGGSVVNPPASRICSVRFSREERSCPATTRGYRSAVSLTGKTRASKVVANKSTSLLGTEASAVTTATPAQVGGPQSEPADAAQSLARHGARQQKEEGNGGKGKRTNIPAALSRMEAAASSSAERGSAIGRKAKSTTI